MMHDGSSAVTTTPCSPVGSLSQCREVHLRSNVYAIHNISSLHMGMLIRRAFKADLSELALQDASSVILSRSELGSQVPF